MEKDAQQLIDLVTIRDATPEAAAVCSCSAFSCHGILTTKRLALLQNAQCGVLLLVCPSVRPSVYMPDENKLVSFRRAACFGYHTDTLSLLRHVKHLYN